VSSDLRSGAGEVGGQFRDAALTVVRANAVALNAIGGEALLELGEIAFQRAEQPVALVRPGGASVADVQAGAIAESSSAIVSHNRSSE